MQDSATNCLIRNLLKNPMKMLIWAKVSFEFHGSPATYTMKFHTRLYTTRPNTYTAPANFEKYTN